MFGTLKPGKDLSACRIFQHKAHYCGLCKSLGLNYGQIFRPLVSFDAVFLSIIIDALRENLSSNTVIRCPMAPWVLKTAVSPHSVSQKFASAVQILLADQWAADRSVEKAGFKGVRFLLGDSTKKAVQNLQDLGINLSSLEDFETKQLLIEQSAPTPYQVVLPSSSALGIVFEQAAILTDHPECALSLKKLGIAVGELIYVIDALADLREDYLKSSFNPCISNGKIDFDSILVCEKIAENALNNIACQLDALPFYRYKLILADILLIQQRAFFTQGSNIARLAFEEQAKLYDILHAPPITKVQTAFLAFFVSLWVWFGSIPQAIAGNKNPTKIECAICTPFSDACGDLGKGCGDFCNGFGEICGVCSSCGDEIGGCCSECGGTCDQCETTCSACGDSCNDCSNCCTDCGNGCNDCSNGCNSGCSNCGGNCQ